MTFRYWTFDVMLSAEGVLSELNVQKLLTHPPALEDFLASEIALLDRLVERAMKKKPKSVPVENEEKVWAEV